MKRLDFIKVPHSGLPNVEAVYAAEVHNGQLLVIDGARAGELSGVFVPAPIDVAPPVTTEMVEAAVETAPPAKVPKAKRPRKATKTNKAVKPSKGGK